MSPLCYCYTPRFFFTNLHLPTFSERLCNSLEVWHKSVNSNYWQGGNFHKKQNDWVVWGSIFLFHPHHQWGLVPPGRCWSGDTRIFIFYFNTCTYVDNTFERDRGLIDLMIQMYYVIYVCTKACTFSRWRSLAPCMPLMAVQPLYNTPVTSRDFLRKTPTWRLSSNRRWILGHSEPTPQKNNGMAVAYVSYVSFKWIYIYRLYDIQNTETENIWLDHLWKNTVLRAHTPKEGICGCFRVT